MCYAELGAETNLETIALILKSPNALPLGRLADSGLGLGVWAPNLRFFWLGLGLGCTMFFDVTARCACPYLDTQWGERSVKNEVERKKM